MALIPGSRYAARVAQHGLTEATNAGTPGVFFNFDCGESGSISHTVYIAQTSQALEISSKTFMALGATEDELKSAGFWSAIREGQRFDGAECELVIGEEEYKGQKRIVVKFINGKAKPAKAGTEDYLAKLFGGGSGGGGSYRSSSAPPDFPDPDAPARPRY